MEKFVHKTMTRPIEGDTIDDIYKRRGEKLRPIILEMLAEGGREVKGESQEVTRMDRRKPTFGSVHRVHERWWF